MVGDLACHDPAVRRRTEAHADVDVAIGEAGGSVRQQQLDFEVRVLAREFRDGRGDETAAEAEGRLNLQQSDRNPVAA